MAKYGDIVGWFYRNGKRIPIRSKKGEKAEQKYITKKSGARFGDEYYSTDYDTSGGHVHKDHDTIDEARDFLRRNGVTKRKEFRGVTKREPDKDALRKNVNARGAKNKKLTWSEKYERDNRRKLMKERGVTNWKDVPDYLKQSTGTQTPGSMESLYGTSKKRKKK